MSLRVSVCVCVCMEVCVCMHVRVCTCADTGHRPSLGYTGEADLLSSVLGEVCICLAGSGALQSSGGASLISHTGTEVCMASCSFSKLSSSSCFVGTEVDS